MRQHLKEFTEQLNLNPPLYYYDGDSSVCLIMNSNGEPTARGVAVCSPLDPFVRKTGRNIAINRALQALGEKQDNGTINFSRFDVHKAGYPRPKELQATARLRRAAFTYGYKSTYKPELTELEKKLLRGSKLYATIK